MDNIVLEFDLDRENSELPVPSFFLGITNAFLETSQPNNYYQWVDESVIELMLKNQLSPEVKSKVGECFIKVPKEGRIFHIGLMLARTSNSVRLCLDGLSGVQILEYLSSIGWQDLSGNLSRIILDTADAIDRLALNIDVGKTVNPKIGLECYFDALTLTGENYKLSAFLDYLVENELCAPDKRDALLKWRGYNTKNSQEFWPPHLLAASKLLKGNFVSTLDRIKL